MSGIIYNHREMKTVGMRRGNNPQIGALQRTLAKVRGTTRVAETSSPVRRDYRDD